MDNSSNSLKETTYVAKEIQWKTGPGIAGKSTDQRKYITPRARMLAKQEGVDISEVPGTGPEGLIIEKDVKSYLTEKFTQSKDMPFARKYVEQNDVKLDGIEGIGARGKVTKTDIENESFAGTNSLRQKRGERAIPFTGMRKAIAGNMMNSLHGMAQSNHRMKVDATEILRMRYKLKEDGIKVSYTDILAKIVSKALLDFPIVNSSLTDEGIVLKDYVNIGIAVALDDGLIVPVIRNADLMTIQEISAVASKLIEKAKRGNISPNECKGGTFTVTNLGMFDIDEFTAIINPPESAILAIGKIDRIPVAEGNNIVIRPIVVLSLTYDHRIIDGAPAAQFLQRIKQLVQNPNLW
jgi:pyruvate dehydrogenase E2 component (dihydrolipoamide acetyltransferase)